MARTLALMSVHTHAHRHTHTHTCKYICIYIHIYLCMYICMYIYTYTYTYTYIYIYHIACIHYIHMRDTHTFSLLDDVDTRPSCFVVKLYCFIIIGARMMVCLPQQGTPPIQQPTWPTAHTAHSQHCGHTALCPGQKTNPRK